MKRRPFLPYLASLLAVVAGCGLMYRPGGPDVEANLFTVQGAVNDAPASTAGEVVAGATAAAPAERIRPQRVVVLGDSTGEFLGRLMANYAEYEVDVRALRRCPLRPDEHTGQMRPNDPDGQWQITDNGATYPGASCGWSKWIADVDFSFADVYVFAGPMMLTDMDDGNVFTAAPLFTAELRRLIEVLYSRGVSRVVLLTPQSSTAQYGHADMFWLDPARNAAWTQILRDAATAIPGETAGACLLDYAAWANTQPEAREDGAHLSGEEGQRHAAWVLSTVEAGACA
jgi:hypothetical protein